MENNDFAKAVDVENLLLNIILVFSLVNMLIWTNWCLTAQIHSLFKNEKKVLRVHSAADKNG